MSLQARILEVLGDNPMRPQSLYRAMAGENSAGVDGALRGLLKAGAITFELGMYQRAAGRSVTVVAGEARGKPVAAAAIAVLKATPRPAIAAAEPETQRCKRCGEDKPLDEFQPSNLGNGIRLKTCKRCVGRKPKAIAPEPSLPAPANAPVKEEVKLARKSTFSPGITARLIESQRRKAEELHAACDRVGVLRQELADIEELVRMATQQGAA